MLTDEIIQAATKPGGKVSDGHSLYVMLLDGKRRWRLRLKGTDYSLGEYPAVSIAEARTKAAALRAAKVELPPAPAILAAPAPAQAPAPVNGAMPTFGEIAHEWAEFDQAITPHGLYRKELHVRKFAPLHALPLTSISVAQCSALCATIRKESGLPTAKRAGEYLNLIYLHAAAQRGLQVSNPAANHVAWIARTDRKVMSKRRQKHLTDPHQFGLMAEAIDMWAPAESKEKGAGTSQTAQSFLRFIMRIPVRASELAGARWAEFRDLDDPAKALWIIPGPRMKQREEFAVPLPPQALAILLEQRAYVVERYPRGSEYVFPNRDTGSRHIKGDNQKRSLNALGWGKVQSIHGMRHSFATLAAKAGKDVFLADRCLAHSVKGVMGLYLSTDLPEQRRAMLQWWADEIERLKNGYKVPA